MNLYTSLYEKHFPLCRKKVNNKTLSKPWITPTLQNLIKKENKLFSKKLKSKKQIDINNYRTCKKDVECKLEESKTKYFYNRLYHKSKTLKQKWNTIRDLINRQRKAPPHLPPLIL